MICVSLGKIPFEKALEISSKEELVEIRADLMDLTKDQLHDILETKSKKVFTFRSAHFSQSRREEYFRIVLHHNIEFIDLDYAEDKELLEVLSNAITFADTQLILSSHNYERTPSVKELNDLMMNLESKGPDIIKIACRVIYDEDIVNLLSLYRKPGKKIILGMGQKGIITRVAALYMGAEFTYAFPEGEEKTAPGQLTRKDLEDIMEIMKP